jgi:Periplasmic copper-binding protein (NosD)
MFNTLHCLVSWFLQPSRLRPRRISAVLMAECLEDRLTPSGGPAPAGVSFSTDQKTVTINADSQTWTLARPVVSSWNYTASGATYWVATNGSDSGNGTSAHPFATIQHAVNVAGPGDIVYVEAGTYVQTVSITKSGQASKPIIISAAPGALGKVTITPSQQYVQANPSGAVFTVATADYVWINGFVIEGPRGRTEAPAAEHYGANGITWANGAGLGDQATNNVVYDNVHCGMKEMGHGGTGIFIQGNIIFDNGSNGLDQGIYMPANNTTMDGNVIFDNTGYGIQSYTAPMNQVISHNIIFGNATGGIIIGGSNNQVLDNTVVYNSGWGIFYFRGLCTNNVVEHNIFAFNTTNAGWDDGGGKLGDPSNNLDDYNVYYGGKMDSHVKLGAHEVFADPLLLNALIGDFRLKNGAPALTDGAFAS